MRTSRLPLLAALLALLLGSACLRIEYDVVVEDDGSGTLEAVLAINPDGFGALGGMMGEMDGFGRDEICEEFRADTEVPPGVDVRDYDEDGFCGYRLRARWDATDDPGAALDAALSGGDLAADDGAVLRREPDGGWLFVVPVDAGDMTAEASEVPPFMAEQLFGESSVRFRVTLPGRPVEHNATSVSGNTFTWDIDLLSPLAELRARTEPGSPPGSGGGFPWLLVVALVVAVVAVVGVVLLVRRGAKATADPLPPAGGGVPEGGVTSGGGPGVGAGPVVAGQEAPQPVWDAAAGAWIVEDPVRGRLRHDPASGQWVADAPGGEAPPASGPPPA